MVEALHGGVPERMHGVDDENLEREVNVVVFDFGVLVLVDEPKDQEDGGVFKNNACFWSLKFQ